MKNLACPVVVPFAGDGARKVTAVACQVQKKNGSPSGNRSQIKAPGGTRGSQEKAEGKKRKFFRFLGDCGAFGRPLNRLPFLFGLSCSKNSNLEISFKKSPPDTPIPPQDRIRSVFLYSLGKNHPGLVAKFFLFPWLFSIARPKLFQKSRSPPLVLGGMATLRQDDR